MVTILSEYVHESIIVGLTLGQADGSGVQILLEQCLQLCLRIILIKTDQLVEREGRSNISKVAMVTWVRLNYPSIFEQHIERAPFTDHINHSCIEGVLVG